MLLLLLLMMLVIFITLNWCGEMEFEDIQSKLMASRYSGSC